MSKQKYIHIKEILEKELLNGTYPCGDRLPTTKELCEKYHVSDFVMTKAIKLLSRQGLIEAKVGSGIYSKVHGADVSLTAKHLNHNLFFVPKKKNLLIWVEDSLPHQLTFWKQAFESFLQENIDINIELGFGLKVLEENKYPDIIIGGISHLNNSPFGYEDLMDHKLLNKFYPDIYNEMLFSPEFLAWGERCALFPIGFSCPFMLCHQENWHRDFYNGSTHLEIFDLASQHFPDKIICEVWNMLIPLISEGCCWINSETAKFSIQNTEKWRQTLKLYRNLYRSKKITLTMAQAENNRSVQQTIERLKNEAVFKEISMPGVFAYRNQDDIVLFPFPAYANGYLESQTINAMILQHTMYPEECLRVITHFLSRNIQMKYLESGVGFCIDKKILLAGKYGKYFSGLDHLKNVFSYPPDKLLHMSVNEILIWEIYNYLQGIGQGDILERIELKTKYFLKNACRIPLEAFSNDSSKKLLVKYLNRVRQKSKSTFNHEEILTTV